jgi:adenosine/AMP kinase
MSVKIEVVQVPIPEGTNVIIGHSHFIKTVEDLYEAIITTNPNIRFGLAFNEASGKRLVRKDGNDSELIKLASEVALKIGAGHTFVIYIKGGWPINILNALKNVQEVVRIHAATANPLQVLVAQTEQGRGVIGVIDGFTPLGIENETDEKERKDFLRKIGYKR